MSTKIIILDRKFAVSPKYRVILSVQKIEGTKKYKHQIKSRFILIDVENDSIRLLIDNHEPLGFHIHTELPQNKSLRIPLLTEDYNEALNIFFDEVERIIQNEK